MIQQDDVELRLRNGAEFWGGKIWAGLLGSGAVERCFEGNQKDW